MFDAEGAFVRQFTPVEGGYVYYPSRSAGGKLVTNEEYARLLADRRRAVQVAGSWKTFGIGLVVLLGWTFVRQWLALPARVDQVLIALAVAALWLPMRSAHMP